MNGKDITPARGVAAFEHLFCRPDPASGELAVPAGAPGLLLGALRSAAGTNCLAEIQPADAPLAAGSTVNVWLL